MTVTSIEALVDDIKFLNKNNALHRRGFRLRELSTRNVMDHFLEEAHELADSPVDILEAADVLVLLLQILHRNEWTLEGVALAAREKLRHRFTVDIEGGANGFVDTVPGG